MNALPCRHSPPDASCPLCRLALTDPRYGQLFGLIPQDNSTWEKATSILKHAKPCISLRDLIEDTVSCNCPKVFGCEKYGKAVRSGVHRDGHRACVDCPDYRRRLLPDLVDPLSDGRHPDPQHKNPSGWSESEEQRIRHLEAFREVLAGKPAQVKRAGRGIITIGGGKYWPGVVVGIKLLRQSGSDLPVEIWHMETEKVNPQDLEGLGEVTLVNSTVHARLYHGARILAGWENKLFALSHTQLKEVLFLDADAYCIEDPGPLFPNLDDAPFVFWSDLHCQETAVKWDKVWPEGSNGVPPIQGGHFLIDTEKAWPLIRLAHWVNQHSDFYYGHMFGDQDTWRLALSALKGKIPWKHLGLIQFSHPAYICQAPGDIPRIVHRSQAKFFANGLPGEAKAIKAFGEFLEKAKIPA